MCDVAESQHAPMAFPLLSGGLQEAAGPSHLVWPGLFPRGRPWVEEACIRAGPAASSWLLSSATLCGWPLTSLQGMISSVLTVWKDVKKSGKVSWDGLRKFIAVDHHEAVVGWLAPRA